MSKVWGKYDDIFIHAHFDAVGDSIGPNDLGRSAGAVTRRAKVLRESGAWDAMTAQMIAQGAHHVAASRPQQWDEEDVSRAQWMLRNASKIVSLMEADEGVGGQHDA